MFTAKFNVPPADNQAQEGKGGVQFFDIETAIKRATDLDVKLALERILQGRRDNTRERLVKEQRGNVQGLDLEAMLKELIATSSNEQEKLQATDLLKQIKEKQKQKN